MANFIYLILFSLPLYLIKVKIFNIPSTILELEIYTAFVIFLGINIKNRKTGDIIKKIIASKLFLPAVLFLLSGISAVFVSPDKLSALGIFKAYFFDSLLFFFLFISLIKTRQEVCNSFLAIVSSGVLLVGIGFLGYFSIPNFLEDGRLRSIFSSPNYLSLYITPLIFLFIGLLSDKKINKKIIWAALFVLLFGLFLTFSRGAWMGLLVALVFLAVWTIIKKFFHYRWIGFVGALIMLSLVALFIVKGLYLFGVIPSSRIEKSDSIRIEIWRTSWEIGVGSPIAGVGLGNFQSYFGEYTKSRINYPEYVTPHAITPHNMLINIWLQIGILGVASIIWLIISSLKMLSKVLTKDFLLSISVLSSMVAVLSHGLVESTIWKNDLMIYFWFLLGLSIVLYNIYYAEKK
ncbi:O-antigen ligase family protein [Candidatus Microgenomates bacterium]|nr:O-antigen ligase family protein [Candidatus Microgenomates bacterium]